MLEELAQLATSLSRATAWDMIAEMVQERFVALLGLG